MECKAKKTDNTDEGETEGKRRREAEEHGGDTETEET